MGLTMMTMDEKSVQLTFVYCIYLGVADFDASLVSPHPGPFAGGGVGQEAKLVALAAGGLHVYVVSSIGREARWLTRVVFSLRRGRWKEN